ncbi:MAG: Ldh family oxidoreductase [Anaerolineae bacterium]|nr:Ldh family oxidoreductase [Anaerolineae bacterium]
MAEEVARVPVEQLLEACRRILESVGVPPEQARITAEVVVEGDLRGVESHGILRLPAYVHRVQKGLMKPVTEVKTVVERPATVLLDAGGGFGQVAGVYAMERAVEKARQNGAGVAAVRNANHFGVAAYYAMRALPHRMIGMVASNAAPSMAAWGGAAPVLGTNPICVAIPTGLDVDIVLDMASSQVARGKIRLAAVKGETIPAGWALDAEGRPTQDPQEALKGTLMPMGGPKGYGLALVVDVLAGVMTGADFSVHMASVHDLEHPTSVGFVMQAVDISAFIPWEEFTARMRELVDIVRGSPRAPGVERIYLPGEIEWLKAQERRQAGVPVARSVLRELEALARELGVRLELPAA